MTVMYKNATAAFSLSSSAQSQSRGSLRRAIKAQQPNLLALNATIEAAHW